MNIHIGRERSVLIYIYVYIYILILGFSFIWQPTFRFFQGGKSIGDVIGANANALKEKLAAWSK